jgi:serine/threonine protein kinase/formylglycine-generating enzyme required for sulfatase activity
MIDPNQDNKTVRKDAVPRPHDNGMSNLPERIGRFRVLKRLGQGGFGQVFLAYDDDLKRQVAIKVPNPERVARPKDVETYLKEARILASLDHPHIVPVFDLGRTEDGLCYVVSKFVEGSDLAARLTQGRPGVRESVELVATVAEALHYAHIQGLVHRDIKPANILLDSAGKPCVADFGLALKDEDFGRGARLAGTPGYMSPEQARGEGHRVDGRSDIFSLDVVFYELLTGRLPFQAGSRRELLEQIATAEPRPPRMIDDTIPRELERICFKALAKKASERYSTARDMAEDLRHFLQTAPHTVGPTVTTVSSPEGTPLPATSQPSDSDRGPLKIVPKGLRSFDEHDADFFLELLPSPRDRNGLPDSLRFWKTRIEAADPDATFRVGLIYGPSGCGKSSLVKAGLLPRLAKPILRVYIEATPDETENRLLKGLRKVCADLPPRMGLVDALLVLRQGHVLRPGQKVLLVLDQFEQWLHAHRGEENTELVTALRQCDGERVQAIVLVRDDFWMAATRFMDNLEIDLLQGQNTAVVDLFDLRHARKVLAAFGTAYGTLPERPGDTTHDQHAFLDQAITELAQDGKVISVRLALFAEMVKGRPWTPAALREVGGIEGVGVTFLEETFCSPQANPKHRLHQKAAQAVLKALLPETSSDIKGQMRSEQELRAAAGHKDRPREFTDLIHVLDSELRLITPTEPEGPGDDRAGAVPGGRCYVLTHDYLVPSLREWLTRKQRETRLGRAEQRLAERASLWQVKREARQLPSLTEWVGIRLLTASPTWTEPERKMMRVAARKHLARVAYGALLASLLVGIVLSVLHWAAEDRHASRAHDLVRGLFDAHLAATPAIITDLAAYRRWADPLLERVAADPTAYGPHRLRARLALLPVDSKHAEALRGELLEARTTEFPVIRDALAPHAAALSEGYWGVLCASDGAASRRFRAAAALAAYDPTDSRWDSVSPWVVEQLVGQPSLELAEWVDALGPVRGWLTPALAAHFRDRPTPVAADVLGKYAEDEPSVLAGAVSYARADSFPILFARLRENVGRSVPAVATALDQVPSAGDPNVTAARRANLAIAYLRLGAGERLWPMLEGSPDPGVRSYVIDRLGSFGSAPSVLLQRLAAEPDDTVRAGLLLALGGFDEQALPLPRRAELLARIASMHETDGSAAVHAAARWLLGKWGSPPEDRPGKGDGADAGRRWYVNAAGITMVKIDGPVTFLMGALPGQPGWEAAERQHRATIDHSYDIGMTEVTVGQFRPFLQERALREKKAPAPEKPGVPDDAPVAGITWYEAAEYCNWVSEKAGLPPDEWCYEPAEGGRYAEGMKIASGYDSRRGYRLPTEEEWEYACRGGATTSRCYGDGEELLPRYAWYAANAADVKHPVALLLPNAYGLFDMYGNTGEWCLELARSYDAPPEDTSRAETVWSKDYRVVRGGHVLSYALTIRSSKRFSDRPSTLDAGGIRLVRVRP